MEIIKAGKWRAALIIFILFSTGFGVSALVIHTGYLYYEKIITKEMNLNGPPTIDHAAIGITFNATVGEAVTFGQALYMKNDGKLWKASASANTTAPCVALALASIGVNATGTTLKFGFIRDDSWSWTTGGLIYLSTTTGVLTQTRPNISGNQVQIVGYAETTHIIYFNPTYVMVEIT